MTELANPQSSPVSVRLAEIAERIGATVAGPAAYDVDLNGRFPVEAVDALREAGVLSALVPTEHGGMGASITDVSDTIRVLSRHCAATGCVLAMHTIEVFLLLKFGTTPALRALLAQIVEEQLLIANANSEVGVGGDGMRSIASLEPEGDGWRFDKQALAVSYGQSADLIASKIGRCPDAPGTDQVLAIFPADAVTLTPTSDWNTLGLRGTCSAGLHISGHITEDNLFPVPFADLANGGGGHLPHVLLTAVWVGLAEAALEDAHAVVRRHARKNVGTVGQPAMRLAEMLADVHAARSTLKQTLAQLEAAIESDTLADIELIIALRNVRVVTSTTAVRVAAAALTLGGIAGFRRGPEHRLERIIRDAHGGLVMVSLDRALAENAQILPVLKHV